MIFKRFFKAFTKYCSKYTWWLTSIILLLTLFLGYRANLLNYKLDAESLYHQNNRFISKFDNRSEIILLVKGDESALKEYAVDIKYLLENFSELVSNVDIGVADDFFHKNALKLLSQDELVKYGSIYFDPNLVSFLNNLNSAIENDYLREHEPIINRNDELDAIRILDGLEIFINLQSNIMLGNYVDSVGQKAVDAIIFGETYNFSDDKKMMLIFIEPDFNMNLTSSKFIKNINQIEKIIKESAQKFGVYATITSPIVLARDGYSSIVSDTFYISFLLLITIIVLVFMFFRMLIMPITIIATIFIGIIWTLGIYSYFIEYLNFMIVMMAIIFVGIGIYFSVHLLYGIFENRNNELNFYKSIESAFVLFGPGIVVGGILISLAFLSLIFSKINAIKEMGVIIGIGIFIILFAVLIVLPIFLSIIEKISKKNFYTFSAKKRTYINLDRLTRFISCHKILHVIFLLFTTCFFIYKSTKISFDYNYLNIYPDSLESIKIKNILVKEFNFFPNFITITVDNINDARHITYKARGMKTVGLVESISDYLPERSVLEQQFRFLKDVNSRLKGRQIRNQLSSHDIKMYKKEIKRLEANIIELQDLALHSGYNKVYDKAVNLVGEANNSNIIGSISQFINNLDSSMSKIELTYFHQKFSSAFKSTVIKMANTEPLVLESLPHEIKRKYFNKINETYNINVYPEKNIWEDPFFFNQFVEDINQLNQDAEGFSIYFLELMNIMIAEGFFFISISIVFTFIFLLFNFHSIRYALFGIIPIILGIIWLVGFMQILGIKFTFINMLTIPLIIGIGINNVLHILYRLEIEKKIDIVYNSTGRAILLISLLTMCSFGILYFTTYSGFVNVGITLFLGIGTSLLTTFIFTPIFFNLDR